METPDKIRVRQELLDRLGRCSYFINLDATLQEKMIAMVTDGPEESVSQIHQWLNLAEQELIVPGDMVEESMTTVTFEIGKQRQATNRVLENETKAAQLSQVSKNIN